MGDPANPATPRGGPGYGSRCKACNSQRRAEIDARLLSGESTRSVSEWLLASHGERIPHQGLLNHRGEHLDVRAEAAARVEAATPVFEAAVEKVVADVGVLDEVAGAALKVVRGLIGRMSDPKGKPSMADVVLFNGALSNARAAVTDRHELLHGKKLEVTGVGSAQAQDDVSDLHRRAAAAIALATGSADPGAVGSAPTGAAG